ncbi:MAG: transcriptional regulator, partial [Streptococcus sobrinus]
MSVSQIESILSGKLFLTKIEIERTLGRSLSDEENSFLESSPEIIVFPFYGRNYYKLDNELISLTVEGKRAISLLANRSQAIKLGQARTCLHHLAGKSGVSI